MPFDTMFARVTGHLGMGRVKAKLPTSRDFAEIQIQIPNVFGRKGVTPINSQTIVAVYVGNDFDPLRFDASVHFKMTSILNDKQAGELLEAGVIPAWMTVADTDAPDSEKTVGYVFDYSGAKSEEEDGDEEEEGGESDEKGAIPTTNTVVMMEGAAGTTGTVAKKAPVDEGFDLFSSSEKPTTERAAVGLAAFAPSKAKAKGKKTDHRSGGSGKVASGEPED